MPSRSRASIRKPSYQLALSRSSYKNQNNGSFRKGGGSRRLDRTGGRDSRRVIPLLKGRSVLTGGQVQSSRETRKRARCLIESPPGALNRRSQLSHLITPAPSNLIFSKKLRIIVAVSHKLSQSITLQRKSNSCADLKEGKRPVNARNFQRQKMTPFVILSFPAQGNGNVGRQFFPSPRKKRLTKRMKLGYMALQIGKTAEDQ